MHENNTPVLQDQGDIIGSCLEPLLHLAVTEAGLLIKTLDQELHLIGAERSVSLAAQRFVFRRHRAPELRKHVDVAAH